MSTLLMIFIVLALLGYGLKEYYQIKLKTGPHSSPVDVQNRIAEALAQFSPTGRFMDLGSGWGGLVLNLAKKLPEWQIDGVEASPTPWFIANCRSIGKNFGNYRFFIGPIQKQMLQNYDVVYINQPLPVLKAMLPRLVRLLQNDTLLFSHPHPLPRIPNPDILTTPDNKRIYVYNGMDAVAFLNPDKDELAKLNPIPEPAEEVPTIIPSDPNDDNAFEQVPVDTETPTITASAEQSSVPLNQTD